MLKTSVELRTRIRNNKVVVGGTGSRRTVGASGIVSVNLGPNSTPAS